MSAVYLAISRKNLPYCLARLKVTKLIVSQPHEADMDDPSQYLRYAAALIFILALIGALAFGARAFGFLAQQRRPGERRLRIVESLLVDARRRLMLVRLDEREYLVLLSPHGDQILDDRLEVKDIPDVPLTGSTFVTIKTEPR